MTINTDFLYYLVDKYVKSAANGIRVQDGTTTIKTLTPTCTSEPLADGGQASCLADDTTADTYYFDRAYLLRSSYTIDGATSDEIGYVLGARKHKEDSQTLEAKITTKITRG